MDGLVDSRNCLFLFKNLGVTTLRFTNLFYVSLPGINKMYLNKTEINS